MIDIRHHFEPEFYELLLRLITEVRTMTAALDTLTQDVADLTTGVTSLIAGYDSVSAQLAALIAQGSATPNDLTAVTKSIEDLKASVVADLTKNAPPAGTAGAAPSA